MKSLEEIRNERSKKLERSIPLFTSSKPVLNTPKEQLATSSPLTATKLESTDPVVFSDTGWFTKNRLWNLFFFVGMVSGLTFSTYAEYTLEMPTLSSIAIWSTVSVVPLLTILANKTRFVKKDTFVNSQNIELTKKEINIINFIFLTIFSIIVTTFFAFNMDSTKVLTSLLLFTGCFSGFSLYFIVKNCPISILLNSNFWVYLADNAPTQPIRKIDNDPLCTPTYRNLLRSPLYSSMPGNIYYSHTKR